MSVFRLGLLFLFMAIFYNPHAAQACEMAEDSSECTYEDDDNDKTGDRESPESPTKLDDSALIPSRLTDISSQCRTGHPYVIDCLTERLEVLEKDMISLVGFSEARDILRDTAAQLRAVTESNIDADQPRARVSSGDGSFRSTRPLTAVDPARSQQALSQAAAILAEAETRLLRSAESSSRRSVQYQQIAAALGSNKVLLRSA